MTLNPGTSGVTRGSSQFLIGPGHTLHWNPVFILVKFTFTYSQMKEKECGGKGTLTLRKGGYATF